MNKDILKAAQGLIKSDIVFKSAKVVDVFCHEILVCDVAIFDGTIVGLGQYEGNIEIDAQNKYLMPSFIESHVHIESSMLSPAEYAKIVAEKGVTTVIADPHEITNVLGEAGIKYMMESAKSVPVDIRFMMPSCVPATEFDNAGVVINSDNTKKLLEKYNFLGLGEMMNYPGVLNCDDDVLEKIDFTDIVDGHAPAASGNELNAYICAGIKTDHECITADEVKEKIRKGMYIQIREGTQSKDLEQLIGAITPYTLRRLLFCTDDRYLGDIINDGSISNCIKKAVSLGVDPIDAIIISTINPSECYSLGKVGAIASGYKADLILSDDITAQQIVSVYKDGVEIVKDGVAVFEGEIIDNSDVIGTVVIDEICSEDLEIEFNSDIPVIQVLPNSLYTKKIYKDSPYGLNICAVIERHKGTGNIGKCFIDGFKMKSGAIAQTIGHDSHNITVIGENTRDMAIAVNALGKNGGMSVVKDGEVLAVFELPIAGLMSDKDAQNVLSEHKMLLKAARNIEMNNEIDPFMMLSFLSLLVIPEIKLSDKGIFDVVNWKMI